MIDLKANPFYLNDVQSKWVEDTLAAMTFALSITAWKWF